MYLPFLADEEVTDLGKKIGMTGVKAVWRPCDIMDKSRWADNCRKAGVQTNSAEAKVLLVQSQLLRMDGLEVEEKDPADPNKTILVPWDKEKHINRIPLSVMIKVFDDIIDRSDLSEGLEKNSDRPSGSSETKPTASSPADGAPENSETSTGA